MNIISSVWDLEHKYYLIFMDFSSPVASASMVEISESVIGLPKNIFFIKVFQLNDF